MEICAECTSIRSDGLFIPAEIIKRGDFLFLEVPAAPPMPLGPHTALSEAALRTISRRAELGKNYFDDYAKIGRGYAAEVIELLDECDWECPICIAASFPGKGHIRRLVELESDLRASRASKKPSIMMLSGGEPTIHPKFFEVLDFAKTLKIEELYLITNGRLISENIQFCERLKNIVPNIHIYLQYDSFDPKHIELIRGKDHSSLRQKAIENLETTELKYTLVCVVLKGLNDGDCGEILERNLWRKHIAGVTFQPIKFLGRHNTAGSRHTISNFETSELIVQQLNTHSRFSFAPHPCNPLNWSIGLISSSGQPIKIDPSSTKLLPAIPRSDAKRISVIWHTDCDNFVAESVCDFPIVVRRGLKAIPLFVHYQQSAS